MKKISDMMFVETVPYEDMILLGTDEVVIRDNGLDNNIVVNVYSNSKDNGRYICFNDHFSETVYWYKCTDRNSESEDLDLILE